MRSRQKPRRQKGFTLMEVLLVLAILVILGSLVSVSYITIQRNSKISVCKSQINLLSQALAVYYTDVGSFPTDLMALYDPPQDTDKWAGPYLEKIIPDDPWNIPYQYALQQDRFGRTISVISSAGPDGQSGTDDDLSSLDQS